VTSGFPSPRRTRLRARVGEMVKAKVRYWVDGPQILYQDGPYQRLNVSYPSYPTGKVLESVPNDGYPITIGRYTGIHHTTVIIPGAQHHLDWVGTLHAHIEDGQWVSAHDSIFSKGPVSIGNDVLTGYESIISSGVSIGDGAVIGARAMVTRDVEPYSIVVGNPAKHVRYRFDEPTRKALLRIKWWDWSVEKVTAHKDQIHSADVAGFVSRHDPALGTASCPVCG
jgi:acetyltransferase-like isoleucine patch superfamily enzyme